MDSKSDIEKMSVKELNEYYASFGKETLKEEGLMSASDFRQLKKEEKISHLINNRLFDENKEKIDYSEEDLISEKKYQLQAQVMKDFRDYTEMSKNKLVDMIMTEKYGEEWFDML